MFRRAVLGVTTAVALTVVGQSGALADEDNWIGPYVGVHGGFFWGDASLFEGPVSMGGGSVNGLIGGLFGGINLLNNDNLVFGFEADFGLSNAHGVGGLTEAYTYDLHHNGHLRARLGLPVNNVLLFVAGGLSFADFYVGERGLGDRGWLTGWTAGLGVDFTVNDNLFGRLEILYDDYGSRTYTMGLEVCDGALTGLTIRGGLAFQFGGPN